MSEISITVPAEYTGRFKSEALDTLALRAKSLEEAADWHREGKGKPGRLDHEMPLMRAAEEFFAQVQRANGGPLHVTGERTVVVDTLVGCALEAAEEIRDAVESASTYDQARALMDELGEWLTMRDFHGDDAEGASTC